MTEHMSAQAPPPHIRLIQLSTAVWPSRVLYVTARLGLADHLVDGPRSVDSLADLLKVPVPPLAGVLTALVNLGILTRDANQRFTLTPLGEALQTGAPGSSRAVILLMARDRLGARQVVAASRAATPQSANVTTFPGAVPRGTEQAKKMAGSIGVRARRQQDLAGDPGKSDSQFVTGARGNEGVNRK